MTSPRTPPTASKPPPIAFRAPSLLPELLSLAPGPHHCPQDPSHCPQDPSHCLQAPIIAPGPHGCPQDPSHCPQDPSHCLQAPIVAPRTLLSPPPPQLTQLCPELSQPLGRLGLQSLSTPSLFWGQPRGGCQTPSSFHHLQLHRHLPPCRPSRLRDGNGTLSAFETAQITGGVRAAAGGHHCGPRAPPYDVTLQRPPSGTADAFEPRAPPAARWRPLEGWRRRERSVTGSGRCRAAHGGLGTTERGCGRPADPDEAPQGARTFYAALCAPSTPTKSAPFCLPTCFVPYSHP